MDRSVRLVLPKMMVRKLEGAGVYCQTWVTAEKQVRSDRWVLRGVESGGSAREVGRYISFFSPDGDGCHGCRRWTASVPMVSMLYWLALNS